MQQKSLSNEILFTRGNDTVIIPTKIDENAGFDIYANFEEDYMIIRPHETKMIPTGLHSAFSSDYVAILKERGSTGSKGIGQRAGVVDSGYRGEWFVPLTNHNDKAVVIAKESNVRNIEGCMWLPRINGRGIKDGWFTDNTIKHATFYPYEKAICQCIMVEVPQLTTREATMEELLSYESERGTGALGSSGK